MALEPLGSIMSVQTQTVQKTAESKPAAENTEVSTPEQVAQVDTATLSVAKPDGKNSQDGQKSDGGKSETKQEQNQSEKIKKAVEQLNKNMPHSEAIFGIHGETNRVTIKIVDKDTKEVIKEFPPEETLDMIAKVWELAGILVDEKL